MIRLGIPSDRPAFLRLWQEFLKEQREQGSFALDSTTNLMVYRDYFDAYTQGDLAGGALFWMPEGSDQAQGVVLWGEEANTGPWEVAHPRTAILWGVYVAPEHRGQGVGLALEFAALPRGIEQGFTHVSTWVRKSNEHGERMALGFGTKAYAEVHIADLREVAEALEARS